MVVNMRAPCTIKWNETPSVHSATEYVFRNEVAFVPYESLLSGYGSVHWTFTSVYRMFALSNVREPIRITLGRGGLGGVLEP
jgi:hypothetical protein